MTRSRRCLIANLNRLFSESRRNRTMFAYGAMALGTAVAAHAIGGGLAMVVAASAVLFWLFSGDFSRSFAAVICLAGASILAVPELLIATEHSVGYPVLPMIQVAGIAVILAGATLLKPQRPQPSVVIPILNAVLVAGLFALLLYRHWYTGSIFDQVMQYVPILYMRARCYRNDRGGSPRPRRKQQRVLHRECSPWRC